jgi:hypothetical protein
MCARVNIDDQSKILVVGSRDLKGEWTTATAETIRCKMVAIRKYSNLKYFMVRFLQKKTTQICFFSLFKLKINSFFFSFQGSDRHVLILRSANNIRIMDLMEELQRITTVPVQNQKLYYRGQELQLMKDRTLRDLGIENNAQVRLIGDPIKQKYDALITGNRPN